MNRFDIGSDHRLVRAKIVIDKKQQRRQIHKHKAQPIYYKELKRAGPEFRRTIENKLASIQNHKQMLTNIEELNKIVTSKVKESAREVLKTKPNKKQELNDDIRKLLELRKQLNEQQKKRTIEYAELNKLIRKKIKENRIKKKLTR